MNNNRLMSKYRKNTIMKHPRAKYGNYTSVAVVTFSLLMRSQKSLGGLTRVRLRGRTKQRPMSASTIAVIFCNVQLSCGERINNSKDTKIKRNQIKRSLLEKVLLDPIFILTFFYSLWIEFRNESRCFGF